MSLRGRSAAVAILKLKAWYPAPKHGSTKQEEIPITKNIDSLLCSASSLFIPRLCFVPLYQISFRDDKSFRYVCFPNKNVPILCHCEERSDVAILKSKVWYPGTKHGSMKQEEIPITKNRRFAASFRVLSLHSKALFRSALPYFVS